MDLPSTAAGLERRVGVLAERPGRSRAQPVSAWSGREIRFSCRSSTYHTAAATLPGCLVLRTGSKRWKPRRENRVVDAKLVPANLTTFSFPPKNYNWEICTKQNYAQLASELADGPLFSARRLVDKSYHGHYIVERQRFQDSLVTQLVDSIGISSREPRLIFTAGAMGVGKSHVIRWMKEKDILPLHDFVYINPDRIAAQLPEYHGYIEHNRACAAVMTRLEAGLLTELSLMYALQKKRNMVVDSSLRHGSWYSRVLQKIRQKLPEVRVVLMYVHAREETVYRRAIERGVQGRVVSKVEVADSLEKLPLAIQKLLPHVDTFIQVDNNNAQPRVTSVCHQGRDDADDACDVDPEAVDPDAAGTIGWAGIRELLQANQEPGLPLSEPPEILPSTTTEGTPNALKTLFRTIHFAAMKHRHQTRKNPQQTPYINHPLAVARILAESGVRDLATLQAALLHDTLEDTEATRAELAAIFGSKVADLVHRLTDEEGLRPLHQKFRQLRRVKSLPLQSKLVRIADKIHNVWDLMRHGIPGWSQSKTERYVAWACEMVEALRGTHAALEQRFHSEVSLPKGYQMGDWEEFAVQEMGWFGDTEDVPSEPSCDVEPLEEHRAVLSLLRAAEHVAIRSEEQLLDSVKFALLLTNHDIKDPETLKAALLWGTCDGTDRWVASFGGEVALILRELEAQPGMVTNPKAKRLLLGKYLHELRKLQVGTFSKPEELQLFQQLLDRTLELRETLRGAHPPLEKGIDSVTGNGQVRLASGELTAVYPDVSARQPAVQRDRFF